MATTTDLTTLKINYLSQAQYDNALANNQINPNELYFTPADNGVTLNVNGQSTSSPSFYAPTDSGTAGNFLKSGGSGVAPTWAALTSSEVITALGSQTKNYVLAAPSSANGTPSFRALVADDIPTLSITDKTSDTLTVARGGTGNTSYDANRVIYSESASKLSASGHYASSSKLAINSTSEPDENFYVEGTSYLNGRVILNTTTAASNSNAPSLRVVQNTEIPNNAVNHMAQFLAPNMVQGGANALVLGKAVSLNQAGGLMYTYGGTAAASSLAFGFVNNLGLLKITSSGSIYINSGSSSTHNTNTSELLVKGRVVVDPSYHNTNNFSEFRINRSTAGWSAITLGGAQGTTSGAGLGVWLIGNQNTPNDATTAAASITDSQFYISYSKAANADCRIQGHNADGFSIRPRLAVNANVNTDYSLYVNGTSLFFGRVISNTAATDAIVVEHGTANRDAGVTVRRTDTGTSVWMGVGASGTYGLYSPALTSWMIYGDTSGVYVNGNAATATAAKLTTTKNAVAYYTDTAGTFGTKASANGALYATAANGALQWGTLPVAQGGTGATTAAAARANLGTLGSKLVGSFEGMTTMSGDDTKWIRTTTVGIIPYEAGGAGSGHSALGTATWYFADAYVDHMHGVDIVTNYAGAGQGLQIQSNSKRVAQLYLYTRGTTSVTGSAQFILGNNIAAGTAENAAGMIQIYGTNTGYHRIQPTASTSNYKHYLPNATGWIATGGDGTSTGVGSASQPVYLSSAGVLTACSTRMQIVSYTGNNTLSMSITFKFAPDIIIALNDNVSDNLTGVGYSLGAPHVCDMSKVTTGWQSVNYGTFSTPAIGIAYFRASLLGIVVCSKSSDGKTYYLKVDTTYVNTLPSDIKNAWSAGGDLRIPETAVYNKSGMVSRFLGIKI